MDSVQERCSKLLWQCTPRRCDFHVFFRFSDTENLFLIIYYFVTGLVKNQQLPINILTPTTKAADHDVPVTPDEVDQFDFIYDFPFFLQLNPL